MSVQLAILGFLRERNYHGYELKKTIERQMGAWTDIKFGSLYHALNNLEKEGFVVKVSTSSEGGKPARSIFSITKTGHEEFCKRLKDNILNLQRVFLKEDIGVFFGGKMDKGELLSILKERLKKMNELKEHLELHKEKIKEIAPCLSNLPHWLIMHHLMHVDVEIEWFQKIIQELIRGNLYPSEYSVDFNITPEKLK
ncbi:PadR family transcriptional regulator [bacterium]|nr:PadR family transcriptional regulator [bacterium]